MGITTTIRDSLLVWLVVLLGKRPCDPAKLHPWTVECRRWLAERGFRRGANRMASDVGTKTPVPHRLPGAYAKLVKLPDGVTVAQGILVPFV